MIRKAEEKDLNDMIAVYKEAFPVHNIFEKSVGDNLEYLKKFIGSMLVAEEDGKVVGGLVITEDIQNDGWKVARFKHIAVAKDFQGKGIGSALVAEAEKIVGESKVEIHTEDDLTDYYGKFGYKLEGTLKAHYGKDRDCVILGKILEE